MISGRSLGHTGGTLDKLETIPGFDTQLPLPRMTRGPRASATPPSSARRPRLVPADRILYAMRDHTGTVESPFLICASIMSKKLAEDLNAASCSTSRSARGAFMPTYEKSKFLAELMVSTGEAAGTRTAALLTTMDEPLGRFSGNWVEVWECVDIMQRQPPPHVRRPHRALQHPLRLDALPRRQVPPRPKPAPARRRTPAQRRSLQSLAARSSRAQGGDTAHLRRPRSLPQAHSHPRPHSLARGYLAGMDCKQVGWAVQRLGAGRAKPGDPVSAHAGIESHAKLGDKLEAGQPLFTLFSEDAALLDEPYRMLQQTVVIADQPPPRQPLVREVVLQPF